MDGCGLYGSGSQVMWAGNRPYGRVWTIRVKFPGNVGRESTLWTGVDYMGQVHR